LVDMKSRMNYTIMVMEGKEIALLGEATLDFFKKGLVGTSKVVSDNKIKLDGHPGFEVSTDPGNGVRVNARAYYVNGKVYGIVVGGPADDDTTKNTKVVFDSFRLLKPVAVANPPSKDWKELASKEGRFSVQMPGNVSEPETKTEKE